MSIVECYVLGIAIGGPLGAVIGICLADYRAWKQEKDGDNDTKERIRRANEDYERRKREKRK